MPFRRTVDRSGLGFKSARPYFFVSSSATGRETLSHHCVTVETTEWARAMATFEKARWSIACSICEADGGRKIVSNSMVTFFCGFIYRFASDVALYRRIRLGLLS